MPLLTLFTAPKPFVDAHIKMIQTNTLKNWLALGDDIKVVVIGDEPGVAETCQSLGILHVPDVKCNALGTPLISSIFELARQVNDSPYLMYSNADILFMPGFVNCARMLGGKSNKFLAVGQRWDLDIKRALNFSGNWVSQLQHYIAEGGVLHKQTGSDYFLYPRDCFKKIPDFAVGRAGWDNWMIFWARWQGWQLVDVTGSVTAIHQNHDYRHLPGGARHYRLPETHQNVKLAGGRRTIFQLTDAPYEIKDGKVVKSPLTWKRFWREVEIFPLVSLHSFALGWISFAIFHPVKAFQEVKAWLVSKIKKPVEHTKKKETGD